MTISNSTAGKANTCIESQSAKGKLSRRGFLGGMMLLPCLPVMSSSAVFNSRTFGSAGNNVIPGGHFVNGHHDEAGQFYVSGFDVAGNEQFRLALPEMPHSFALDPVNNNRVVALPGLPGTRAVVMDIASGRQLAQFKSRAGRHFNGHAVFSPDGRLLFTSENIIENAEGIITVRETKSFRFLRELSGHGIGPHEIRLLPDGKTLVVASGGIATHPDTGKHELNINRMRTALLFIDSETGKLLARRESPVDKLSIRHIDVGKDGTVLVACQYKGRRHMPKMVGIQRGESEIEMLDIDRDSLWLMNNYTASALIANNNIAAVTCPRGNQLTFWDLKQKKLIKMVAINDVGAIEISADGGSFIASAGRGKLYRIDAKSLQVTSLDNVWKNVKWTNHMVKVLA